jgi:hypothetical protein
MADQLQLEFPFLELNDYEVVFGGIRNYQEVIAAVPSAFYNPNAWSDAALYLFKMPLTDKDREQLNGLFITDSADVAKAQVAYLRAWLGSFEPQHQVKTAVCGWLMSKMFTSAPKLGT